MGKRIGIAIFIISLSLIYACAPPPHEYFRRIQVQEESPQFDSTAYYVDPQSLAISAAEKAVSPHIAAALFYNELGEWQHALDEFNQAFQHLDSISIKTTDEKFQFIEKHARLPVYYQSINIRELYTELEAKVSASKLPGAEQAPSTQGSTRSNQNAESVLEPMPYARQANYSAFIEKEIRKLALKFGEDNHFQLEKEFIKEVEKHIIIFQTEKREFFERTVRRSRKYFPLVKPIFAEKEIPEELIYMATVESGFSPTARSRSNALGLWQLIAGTAKYYGLTVSRYRDERYDPMKSTLAAREYLLDLLTIFGSRSFMLAMAAYNTGEGNVQSALKKLSSYKDRNFWKLRDSGLLFDETNHFVPQILASIIINTNLAFFGFEDVPFIHPSIYSVVEVPYKTGLSKIAEAAGIDVAKMIELNPDLPPDATTTPSNVLNYPLFVPAGKGASVDAALKALHKVSLQKAATYKSQGDNAPVGTDVGEYIDYRVRQGNTPSEIASWFDTSVARLEQWNPFLKNRGLRTGDTVRIYVKVSKWRKIIHTVNAGETLSAISARYNTPIRYIRGWNGLPGDRIYKSQRLVLYAKSSSRKSTPVAISNSGIIEKQFIPKGASFQYKVELNNTLVEIAEIFKVSVSNIVQWNQLNGAEPVADARITLVAADDLAFIRYSALRGDNLSTISSKFGTTIATLKELNNLQSDRILVGDELRIFTFSYR
ncbi:LysM peptidoglycan-binding domain-containing protein [candidate division KSB1 bacterium]|nr:LysM peptidoglycan-binding domain-containing protein [candidate division KSB1 bacterium]